MATAIVVSAYGGPEALKVENMDVAEPGLGDLRISITIRGLMVRPGEAYPLTNAARTHETLESRSRMGTLLLKP